MYQYHLFLQNKKSAGTGISLLIHIVYLVRSYINHFFHIHLIVSFLSKHEIEIRDFRAQCKGRVSPTKYWLTGGTVSDTTWDSAWRAPTPLPTTHPQHTHTQVKHALVCQCAESMWTLPGLHSTNSWACGRRAATGHHRRRSSTRCTENQETKAGSAGSPYKTWRRSRVWQNNNNDDGQAPTLHPLSLELREAVREQRRLCYTM